MPITAPPLEKLPKPALLIGDQRIEDSSGGVFDHVYGATGKTTANVTLAGAREIDLAVQAAQSALPAWRATSPDQRRELLLRAAQVFRENADELIAISQIDNSMPVFAAAGGPSNAADAFSYYAGWADKVVGDVIPTWPTPSLDYATLNPYGVVGIIIPWNGPIYAVGMTVAPALAAGNCVLLKPPELAPYAAIRIGELFLEAGFPPGVLNVVTAGPEGGQAMVAHPGIDKIHFTGSGATAKHILDTAKDVLKPVGLELGGKSANIIFADADLNNAAMQAILGMQGSGQGCINGTRVLVERPVYEEVLALVQGVLGTLEVGDPLVASTFFGPVINASAAERIMRVIDTARSSGARVVAGGERLGGDLSDGYFIAPTVFADVDNSSPLAREEIFGPVVAVIPFDTEEEAVRIANDSPFGLAAYVQTSNLKRAHAVAQQLDVGLIWINGFLGIPTSVPFGGVKQSGWGRLGGFDGIREFTQPKNVFVNLM
ncbi:aldehyde dehydrogenase [Mycobacterium sp. E342]|uniref:aldehyde dehydrogenase family protein n=1 Tax=Mycobacterium sp. E342 TaxID=1834147 RepID=UPI0007FB8228|nr:aldehyde dehydrogenase [Mycobacterium sp. E342]